MLFAPRFLQLRKKAFQFAADVANTEYVLLLLFCVLRSFANSVPVLPAHYLWSLSPPPPDNPAEIALLRTMDLMSRIAPSHLVQSV